MTDTRDTKPYWHDALTAFGRMSAWILGPILAALFAGKWLDAQYGTGQIWFLCLTGFAFVASTFGLVQEGKKYIQKAKNDTYKKTTFNESNEPSDN